MARYAEEVMEKELGVGAEEREVVEEVEKAGPDPEESKKRTEKQNCHRSTA